MTSGETVGQIGEREVIRRLRPWLLCGPDAHGGFGTGDDCAILAGREAERCVLTTDLLMEGTHFLSNAETDWMAVGRKAAAANISDLAAMGSAPAALLVSVALPERFLVEDLLALYRGIHEYGVPITGGDTTRADMACISITAIGYKDDAAAGCLRSDAKPGDAVYVTGDLGGSRAGLQLVLKPDDQQNLSADLRSRMLQRHFSPTPRVDVGLALARLFERVSVIDISDSIYNESALLSGASGVKVSLELDKVPVSPLAAAWCRANGADAQRFALFSGEEYELLFTLPAEIQELRDQLSGAGVNCPVTQVGTVNPGSGVELLKGGHPVDLPDETFVHF